MIIVHHLEDSRSQRLIWLLEEMDLDYKVKRYERDPVTSLAPSELYDIHPLGKAPVLTDEDRVLAETGAIFDYLLETYDTSHVLHPAKPGLKRDSYRYWMHYAEGSAMTNLLLKLVFTKLPERAPWPVRPLVRGISAQTIKGFIDPRIAEHAVWWNKSLEETGYFVGETFSAADIMMSFPVEALNSRFDLSPWPVLTDFLSRLHARPAYQNALKSGGPYAYASAEPG